MIVTEENVLHAELEVLRQLVGHRSAIAGVVKIIRLEPRKDDFVLMPVPNKRPKDRVCAAKLLEKIKGDRHVLRRAQHWIAKGEGHQPLAVFALWNGAVHIGPRRSVGFGEVGLALIQVDVNMLAQES